MIQFDEHVFQMGWFNQQLVQFIEIPEPKNVMSSWWPLLRNVSIPSNVPNDIYLSYVFLFSPNFNTPN